MKTSSLDYHLPEELIATHPITPRDRARLMVVDRKRTNITDSVFTALDNFLKPGDILVFNKSKVFPARIFAKAETGKRVEILFLNEKKPGLWEVLVGGRAKDGERLSLGHGVEATVHKDGDICLEIGLSKGQLYAFLEKYGSVPLPPYIKRKATTRDKKDYQNVFAQITGSAASPTAGLHFTPALIQRLQEMGVEILFVTLHVGLGTFAPIKTEKVEEHQIHHESYDIDTETKEKILAAKRKGKRIVACGTTSLRVLESLNDKPIAEKGETNIFIYPGYKFKTVDVLITNFHTPRSSLLALVWAFGGERLMKKAYRLAIKRRYRFFSYGDGMLII
jgi:S-adenosylmethionine:tRNA ribosyltransferase-isomerase